MSAAMSAPACCTTARPKQPRARPALPGSFNVNPVGLVGGAQAGFDYQFSSVVVGAQASLSDSYITGQTTETAVGGAQPATVDVGTDMVCQRDRALGYAANTLLFYVKGGGAWMHIEHVEDNLAAGGITTGSQSISDTRSGFVAGVGLEYAMTENLSALFEYDFYDFGTKTEHFTTTPIAIRSDLHTLTVGLNYRFNLGFRRPALLPDLLMLPAREASLGFTARDRSFAVAVPRETIRINGGDLRE